MQNFELIQIEIDHEKLQAARPIAQARAAQIVGITRECLSLYENGHRTIPGKVLLALCLLYNVHPMTLAKKLPCNAEMY